MWLQQWQQVKQRKNFATIGTQMDAFLHLSIEVFS
jgi:hypothetical protein